MVAKRGHQGPILARVGIDDRRDLGGDDRAARIAEHRRVQDPLGDACILWRCKLGPREIGLEELIRNQEAAAVIAVEQVMPAGEPEIGHAIVASTTYCWPSIPQHGNRDGETMSATRSRRELRRTTRIARAATLAIGLAFAWCTGASAQPYPSRPIHIVVPFAPGGITDVLGRALGQRLSEAWGQQVVIENKPGGGTPMRPSSRRLTSTASCPTIRSTILSPS